MPGAPSACNTFLWLFEARKHSAFREMRKEEIGFKERGRNV
jgi:hypothetical protein